MGLQPQLTDLSSDSMPLILFALLLASVNHLRSFLLLPLRRPSLNLLLSYRYRSCSPDPSDCIFCLCRLKEGELVRRLHCHHVFHKNCFDGWLHHLNFNCPLCRSPLVAAEGSARGDLVASFSPH